MRPPDPIQELMERLRVTPRAEFDKRVHDDISQTLAELKSAPPAGPHPVLWRTIMRSSITKLAAAAVIVVVVLYALNMIGNDGVAWAQVLDNVKKAGTLAYRMRLNIVGLPQPQDSMNLESQVLVSADQGVRIISYMKGQLYSAMYLSIPEQVCVSVIPKEKAYLRQTLTDELWEKMEQEHGDPRNLVAKIMQYPHTKLPRRTINGVKVEGLECRDPRVAAGVLSGIAGQTIGNVVGRLWASIENELPVRLEIQVFSENGQKTIDLVQYEYEWDIEIDAAEFEPDIPDDYKLLADVEVAANEESVIEGLRFFAEYADGKYPSELSATMMVRELRDALRAKFGANPPWPPKPGDENRIFALQMAIRFYAWLVMEDRDPAYYGDKVTAEFPRAVLMRWRMDDGRYKVIFGDLTVGEATADELAKLEAAPLSNGQ